MNALCTATMRTHYSRSYIGITRYLIGTGLSFDEADKEFYLWKKEGWILPTKNHKQDKHYLINNLKAKE